MAVYLRLPPGSRGRQCQLGSQSSPPRPAGAIEPPGGRGSPQLRPCLGLGYLNLPMARSQALGDAGKCSPPAALAAAVQDSAPPVPASLRAVQAPASQAGLPTGPGSLDLVPRTGKWRPLRAPDGVSDVRTASSWASGTSPAPPLWQQLMRWAGGLFFFFKSLVNLASVPWSGSQDWFPCEGDAVHRLGMDLPGEAASIALCFVVR